MNAIALPDFSSYGYQLIRVIGQNRQGGRTTYLATELTQNRVVIKQFHFNSYSSWVEQDALEREVQILKQLAHPRIPRYLNSFQTPDGLCLVQEYCQALPVNHQRSFIPFQIKKIAVSLLEILVYLQQRIPPIIHRDIKPENILVDEQDRAYLIDFGFSRIGGEEISGSSVVKGTPGFMPPEQLWGRLTTASDLYSVGMTLICLLGGVKSADIRNYISDDYRVEFRPLVRGVSAHFIEWLEKMVQPNGQERYSSAATALEALLLIDIIPSSFEQKPSQLKISSLIQFITYKQSISAIAFGLIVGVSWGATHLAPRIGLCLGILLGIGLSLVLTVPRTSTKFLSIPPWKAFVGAILVAIATGAVVNPAVIIYYSQLVGFEPWHHQHQKVGQGPGFILYADIPVPVEDARYVAFLAQFRQEVAKTLFEPGKPSCSAEIHLMREDKNYFAIANRFGFKTPYGFFMHFTWHRPIMVVREDSGLGTLTHQIMYHYLGCSYPEGLPSWASQGAATFVEKFLAIEKEDRLRFSWGYRSNWRDPQVRQILAANNLDLTNTLQQGRQQSIYRSLFLFLHHQQQLIPLLDRLHGERGDGIERLEQVFNLPITEIEQLWRRWLVTEALYLPMVESSFMAWDSDAQQVEVYLKQEWVWNEARQMWLKPSPAIQDTIPTLNRILAAQ